MAFEPSAQELALFEDVDDIAAWLELDAPTLDAVAAAAGATTRTLRTWARIPDPRWAGLLSDTRIEDGNGGERGLTPVEEGQVGELRSILGKLSRRGPIPATAAGVHGGVGGVQGGQGGGGGTAAVAASALALRGEPPADAPEALQGFGSNPLGPPRTPGPSTPRPVGRGGGRSQGGGGA